MTTAIINGEGGGIQFIQVATTYAYLAAYRTSRIIQSQKTDVVLLHLDIMTRGPQQAGESV